MLPPFVLVVDVDDIDAFENLVAGCLDFDFDDDLVVVTCAFELQNDRKFPIVYCLLVH